jgi:methyl-accepting chemotaxis protein
MMYRKQRKLKNYIIDRDLQFRVIAGSLIFMLLAVMTTLVVVLFPMIKGMFATDLEMQYRSAQTFLLLIRRLIPVVILLLLFYTVHLILITHKICGPMVNFSHAFLELKKGNLLRRIHLRPGDYLKNEGEKINEMIGGLSQLILRAQENQRLFVADLESVIVNSKEFTTKEDFEKALKNILKSSESVTDSLTKFQVDSAPSEPKPQN